MPQIKLLPFQPILNFEDETIRFHQGFLIDVFHSNYSDSEFQYGSRRVAPQNYFYEFEYSEDFDFYIEYYLDDYERIYKALIVSTNESSQFRYDTTKVQKSFVLPLYINGESYILENILISNPKKTLAGEVFVSSMRRAGSNNNFKYNIDVSIKKQCLTALDYSPVIIEPATFTLEIDPSLHADRANIKAAIIYRGKQKVDFEPWQYSESDIEYFEQVKSRYEDDKDGDEEVRVNPNSWGILSVRGKGGEAAYELVEIDIATRHKHEVLEEIFPFEENVYTEESTEILAGGVVAFIYEDGYIEASEGSTPLSKLGLLQNLEQTSLPEAEEVDDGFYGERAYINFTFGTIYIFRTGITYTFQEYDELFGEPDDDDAEKGQPTANEQRVCGLQQETLHDDPYEKYCNGVSFKSYLDRLD